MNELLPQIKKREILFQILFRALFRATLVGACFIYAEERSIPTKKDCWKIVYANANFIRRLVCVCVCVLSANNSSANTAIKTGQ